MQEHETYFDTSIASVIILLEKDSLVWSKFSDLSWAVVVN